MSEWESLHEPLNRVRREVKKAIPHFQEKYGETPVDVLACFIMADAEVEPELINLVVKIIEDIENEMPTLRK